MKVDIIYTEDCRQGIPNRLPDNCIDLIATDPQYGWGFMGKDWDRAVPSVDIWRQCFRVLKPGAFAFIMSGPRLDCLIENGMRIREAGFVISFTPIFWCFASGFPKAQNISLTIDKKECRKRLEEKLGRKPTKKEFKKEWKEFRKATGYGKNTSHIERGDSNLNEQKYDSKHSAFTTRDTAIETAPATPQAQALDGSYAGFQPKPAVEVILVAMKPLSEKTYVDQALRNGKGITWLDGGRIPYRSEKDKEQTAWGRGKDNYFAMGTSGFKRLPDRYISSQIGRFPANLLVSDDALNDGKITKSTGGKAGHTGAYGGGYKEEYYQGRKPGLGDIGSFSRYFSLDSWWDKKLKELPEGVQKTFPFLIIPKASKAEKNRGCEGLRSYKRPSYEEIHKNGNVKCKKCGHYFYSGTPCQCEEPEWDRPVGTVRGNNHPTVKPIKLFSYLITLGSHEGDIILDPFIGSGTTAIAARMLGRHYVGYEIDEEYVKIAKARLSAIQLELIK